jgi:hypothetical protein
MTQQEKRHQGERSTNLGNASAGSFTLLRQRRRTPTYIWQGYQGWVFENGLQGGQGVEFCLCPPPAGGRAHLAGDSYLFTNRMGRVATVFLHGHRDGTGYCKTYIETGIGMWPKHNLNIIQVGLRTMTTSQWWLTPATFSSMRSKYTLMTSSALSSPRPRSNCAT